MSGTDDRTCVATIDTTGMTAWTSWYEIWEQMTAIVGMCTSHNKEGQAFALGKLLVPVNHNTD